MVRTADPTRAELPMSLDRRHFLRAGAVSVTFSLSGWLGRLANASAGDPKRKRACILLWMIGDPRNELPNFVSVGPQRFFNVDAYGSGFLGPQYAPLVVADSGFGGDPGNVDQALKVQNLGRPGDVFADQAAARLDMLRDMQE